MKLVELKQKLEGVASNLEKLKYLEEYFEFNIDNENSIALLKTIYNPFMRFGLTLREYQKQVRADSTDDLALFNISADTVDSEKRVLDTLKYLASIQPNITKKIVQSLISLKKSEETYTLFCCGLNRTLVKGVNLGLINRAYKNVLSKMNKKKIDLIPSFSVALAEDATGKNLTDLINPEDKWYWSRKVDGQRIIYNSKLRSFYSRAGNIVNSLSSKVEEMPVFQKDYILDGEVAYVEESTNIESFKLTEMLIRKKDYQLPSVLWWSKNGSDTPTENKTKKNRYKFNLKYFVFDCLDPEDFQNKHSNVFLRHRLDYLKLQLDVNKTSMNFIEVLKQEELKYNSNLKKFNIEDFDLPEGWEGYMLRKDAEYKGERSNDMLKLKQFYDTELLCYDVEMTTKRMLNDRNVFEDRECIGALLCRYKDSTVRVGSGLADFDRLKNKSEYINNWIKVKYTQKIVDRTGEEHLRHPVFICIRDRSDI